MSNCIAINVYVVQRLICVLVLLYSSAGFSEVCDDLVDSQGFAVQAQEFEHQFESGAHWQLCWHIDDRAGLTLSNIAYGAPQEPIRTVLKSASLAQILFKYDADRSAKHLLAENGLGSSHHVEASSLSCADGDVHVGENTGICVRLRNKNSLTSLRRSLSKRRHELSLYALSVVGAQSFEQVWRFSEDGEIIPAVRMGGELDRFTHQAEYGSSINGQELLAANAALLFTWRLDFNIAGTAKNDLVEQVEFIPHESNVVRPCNRHAVALTLNLYIKSIEPVFVAG